MRIPHRWKVATAATAVVGLGATGVGLARDGQGQKVDAIQLDESDTTGSLHVAPDRLHSADSRQDPASARSADRNDSQPSADSPASVDTATSAQSPQRATRAQSPDSPASVESPTSAQSPQQAQQRTTRAQSPDSPASAQSPDSPASVDSGGSADS